MRAVIFAGLLLASSAAQARDLNEKVDIAGHTYRVFMRGDEVKVFNKSGLVAIGKGRTIDRMKEMKAAVRQVTGCDLINEFWRNHILAGELRCPSPSAPPA